VYETPSKLGYGPPQGRSRLADAVAAAPCPIIALGGIDASKVVAVRAASAHGVAVVRAILAAPDPAAATRTLLATMH
jgi:thiamine-phosphate pyrophosphorylase